MSIQRDARGNSAVGLRAAPVRSSARSALRTPSPAAVNTYTPWPPQNGSVKATAHSQVIEDNVRFSFVVEQATSGTQCVRISVEKLAPRYLGGRLRADALKAMPWKLSLLQSRQDIADYSGLAKYFEQWCDGGRPAAGSTHAVSATITVTIRSDGIGSPVVHMQVHGRCLAF